MVATSVGGCFTSPRFQAPFTLANPNERHPIAVKQGEMTLDLAVYPGASGLNKSQRAKVVNFLADYKSQSSDRLLIRAPSGGPNETAAMRAYDQVRKALRHAGIDPRSVALEPYFGSGDPSAPVRLSYLQFVAEPPDCPDWSENIGRDPHNMPWPNMGCATQRNLAAIGRQPRGFAQPRGETQRSGERRDVVWDKYVDGKLDHLQARPFGARQCERSESDRRIAVIADAAYSLSSAAESAQAFERVHEVSAEAPRARPVPRVNIQAFCEDQDTAAMIEKASQDRRLAKAHVTVQMGGAQAAAAFYRNAPTPNLIIIESLLDRTGILGELDRLAEVCDPGTKVVAIGHVNDVLLYRELLRRSVSEYVVAPVTVMQIIESISAIYTDPQTAPVGQVIAFVGAKGGSGSSTVCHNTAFAIASGLKSDVVIADFDLPFGTAGLDFNQDPLNGIADALTLPDRFDELVLDRLLSRCSDHLSLFAAPGTLDRPYDLNPSSCDAVLDVVRENVPWTAVDVPHLWTAWAKQVVLNADHVVITAAPDLANLRNTKNLVDQLKGTRPNDRPPLLVLNQVGVPKRPEISVKDFGDAIELEPKIIIDFDAPLFGTAANNGQMIEEVSDKSKAADGFRRLANLLTERSEQKSERQSILGHLLARLRLTKTRV